MQIELSEPKTITTRQGEIVSTTSLTIRRIIDVPGRELVRVLVAELPGVVTVMEGDEYGEWTKADIAALLEERL